jgi:hypothetical protein
MLGFFCFYAFDKSQLFTAVANNMELLDYG